jgi:hypothetical protein
MSNLSINTNISQENINSITILNNLNIYYENRSPLQSPRAKSPTNNESTKCPNAPRKITIEIPRSPRVQNDEINQNNICKKLF